MKCCKGEEYQRVVRFYTETLGLPVSRSWGGEEPDGVMIELGNGSIEIFCNRNADVDTGIIRHIALETEDVEACARRVREAGYEVFIEPRDLLIPSQPPVRARICFCFGPLHEQIEFFQPC
ncbi:MAG: VOC family protein [Clostridia bacterium]|nr:VOC family protein [Clostridia bacterium]